MVRTLFFDCDGTLVCSEELAFTACCTLLNEVLAAKAVAHRFSPETLMGRFAGTTFRQMISKLAREYGFTINSQELEELVAQEEERVIQQLQLHVEATAGLATLLENLTGQYVLAVVSSSALRRIKACLEGANLASYFPAKHLFSAANCLAAQKSKPDPAIYQHAVSALATRAEECVAIEDSQNGVLAAISAGIHVIGYAGCVHRENQADHAAKLLQSGAHSTIHAWTQLEAALNALKNPL